MPTFRHGKVVDAERVAAVTPDGEGATLRFARVGAADRSVSSFYRQRYKPQVGGYWVRYNNGYESFWPAEAFEREFVLEREV